MSQALHLTPFKVRRGTIVEAHDVFNSPGVNEACFRGNPVPIKLTEFITNHSIFLCGEPDCHSLFHPVDDNVWEGHYLFTARVPSAVLMRNCRAMLKHMFTDYGASAIVGKTPRHLRAARALSRALGFIPEPTKHPTEVRYRLTAKEVALWEK